MAFKVLLVDDVNFFLELEKSYLSRTDCDVFTARDGKEALEVAETVLPNVIFLDYEMPLMNGLEFLLAKENKPGIKDIPVVIVSSFVDDKLKKELQERGVKEIIKKPFTEKDFLSVLNRYDVTDKRKKKRVIINMPAFYGFEDDMEKGVIRDISEGGLFLAAERLLKTGAYLELKFLLQGTNSSIKLWCRVVWVNDETNKKKDNYPKGMGLEFVGLGKETIQAIRDFIERVENGY
ncbi:MAG: response regulator [bacterium]